MREAKASNQTHFWLGYSRWSEMDKLIGVDVLMIDFFSVGYLI